MSRQVEYVPGTTIKKPRCKLIGMDGNAFMVLGLVRRALKKAKVPQEILDNFSKEAHSGDYNNLLQTAMKYTDVE